MLAKQLGGSFVVTYNNVGKKSASFTDALDIAEEALSTDYDAASIIYNNFVNVVSYKTTVSTRVIVYLFKVL